MDQKESCRATELAASITGWLKLVLGCLRNNARARNVRLWLSRVDVWQNPWQCCEAIVLQLEQFFLKKQSRRWHLVPHHWLLWPLILCKPLDSSWRRAQFLRHEPSVYPSPPAEKQSPLSISSELCFRIFYSTLVGRESQDFGNRTKTKTSFINRKRTVTIQLGTLEFATVDAVLIKTQPS